MVSRGPSQESVYAKAALPTDSFSRAIGMTSSVSGRPLMATLTPSVAFSTRNLTAGVLFAARAPENSHSTPAFRQASRYGPSASRYVFFAAASLPIPCSPSALAAVVATVSASFASAAFARSASSSPGWAFGRRGFFGAAPVAAGVLSALGVLAGTSPFDAGYKGQVLPATADTAVAAGVVVRSTDKPGSLFRGTGGHRLIACATLSRTAATGATKSKSQQTQIDKMSLSRLVECLVLDLLPS